MGRKKENPLPRNCTFNRQDWEVLSNYWYPIAYSDEVTSEKPIPCKLLDEELVAYRTSKGVVVAKDLCIHRGAPLSMGRLQGDDIICAYHGFQYEPSGQCVRVPAQPDSPIPKRLCIQVYLSEEKYGLVWVCLSGNPSIPLPEWGNAAENPDYRHLQLPRQHWKAAAPRQVENFNDVAHLSWLHGSTFGNPDRPEVEKYSVETGENGLAFDVHYQMKTEGMRGDEVKEDRILYNYRLHFPFSTFLTVNFSDDRHYFLFDYASPTSAKETAVFFKTAQDFNLDSDPQEMIDFQTQVLSEDRPIVEGQRPEELPLDLSEEFHIQADAWSTYYRKALVKMGLGRELAG